MICVRTGSRVHFGLLPPSPSGRHGGCGVMAAAPEITVRAKPSSCWQFSGPFASVAARAVERLQASGLLPPGTVPQTIHVETLAPPHAGLGSGTQVTLAVASALGISSDDLVRVASRLGRGLRSRVGTIGFASGGLVVDWGTDEKVTRLPFPTEWGLWLAVPTTGSPWFGEVEQRAFGRLREPDDRSRHAMIQLLQQDLLVALQRVDFSRFAAALGEYNCFAGRWFAPVQGGLYSTPVIAETVRLLREAAGVAGQSSWGPTVFAISSAVELAGQAEVASVLARLGYRLLATQAQNVGYRLELQPDDSEA